MPRKIRRIEPPLPPRVAFIGSPCPYCGNTMRRRGPRKATRDHKTPRCLGAWLTPENRIIVCLKCNGDKKDYSLGDWHDQLRQEGDPRAAGVGRAGHREPLISDKPQLNRCLQRLHDKAGQTQTGDDKKQLSSRHSQVSFAG